jgi:hypothetical protein
MTRGWSSLSVILHVPPGQMQRNASNRPGIFSLQHGRTLMSPLQAHNRNNSVTLPSGLHALQQRTIAPDDAAAILPHTMVCTRSTLVSRCGSVTYDVLSACAVAFILGGAGERRYTPRPCRDNQRLAKTGSWPAEAGAGACPQSNNAFPKRFPLSRSSR